MLRLIIDAKLCDLRNRNIHREPQEVLLPRLLQAMGIGNISEDELD